MSCCLVVGVGLLLDCLSANIAFVKMPGGCGKRDARCGEMGDHVS